LPNIKLHHTDINLDGSADAKISAEINGSTFTTTSEAALELDVSETGAIFYYNVTNKRLV